MIPQIYITRTPDGGDFPLPSYPSRYHMGLLLHAGVATPLKLNPGERTHIPTGFAFGIPPGFCGQVVSLPALAHESGIIVADAPHIIHPADREPLFLLIQNASQHQFILHRGRPVAQLLITAAFQVSWKEVKSSARQQDEPTPVSEMVMDGAAATEHSPFFSTRREKHSIRERHKPSNEE